MSESVVKLSPIIDELISREASRIGREWLQADWWITPWKRPHVSEPERELSKRIKAWAVRVVRSVLGHRVYQTRRAFGQEKCSVIVKTVTVHGDYRVLLVTAKMFEKVKFEGKQRITPIISLIFYGRMSDKNASILDRFKPHMKRSYRAHGYIMVAYKHGITGGEEERKKQFTVLGANLEIANREDTIVIHRSLRTRKVEAMDKIRDLKIRVSGEDLGRLSWIEYIQCAGLEAWIRESQSKWILVIPPLILSKWYYDISLESLRRSPSKEFCRSLTG